MKTFVFIISVICGAAIVAAIIYSIMREVKQYSKENTNDRFTVKVSRIFFYLAIMLSLGLFSIGIYIGFISDSSESMISLLFFPLAAVFLLIAFVYKSKKLTYDNGMIRYKSFLSKEITLEASDIVRCKYVNRTKDKKVILYVQNGKRLCTIGDSMQGFENLLIILGDLGFIEEAEIPFNAERFIKTLEEDPPEPPAPSGKDPAENLAVGKNRKKLAKFCAVLSLIHIFLIANVVFTFLFAPGIKIFTTVFFGICLLIILPPTINYFALLFKNKPIFIADSNGITNYSAFLIPKFIPWHKLAFFINTIWNKKPIIIAQLIDQEDFIRNSPCLLRPIFKLNAALNMLITVNAEILDIDPENLALLLNEKCKFYNPEFFKDDVPRDDNN